MIYNKITYFLLVFLFISTALVSLSFLYLHNKDKEELKKRFIQVFLKKLNTLPQPFIDLDLTFVSYFPFEDKLNFLLNTNKNLPLRTYKVYRCRLVDDVCFILATGTPLGTHLIYLYTTGSHQVIGTTASIEDNMKLSDTDLIDILEIS